jgi:phosphocarrier protein HPr
MQTRTLTIKNQLGLHARAASSFVKLANKYQSKVEVTKDEKGVDGRSIMGLLTLAAECGSSINIATEGPDEFEAIEELTNLIENRFNEA